MESDAFAKLENRTKTLRKEMENLDKLDELRTLSNRNLVVDINQILFETQRKDEEELKKKIEEEDENELKSVVFLRHHPLSNISNNLNINIKNNNLNNNEKNDLNNDNNDNKKINNNNNVKYNNEYDDDEIDFQKISSSEVVIENNFKNEISTAKLRPKLAIKKKKNNANVIGGLPSFISVAKKST